MRTFLGVCLLLGVAAIMIHSAFGLQCVVCKTGEPKHCKDYNEGDTSFHETCDSNFEKPMCVITGNSFLERSCKEGKRDTPSCWKHGSGNAWKTCQCDTDLCNASYDSGQTSVNNYTVHNPPSPDTPDPNNPFDPNNGKPTTEKDKDASDEPGSGQQGSLKGPFFGILVMVLLGGVGGQLWG